MPVHLKQEDIQTRRCMFMEICHTCLSWGWPSTVLIMTESHKVIIKGTWCISVVSLYVIPATNSPCWHNAPVKCASNVPTHLRKFHLVQISNLFSGWKRKRVSKMKKKKDENTPGLLLTSCYSQKYIMCMDTDSFSACFCVRGHGYYCNLGFICQCWQQCSSHGSVCELLSTYALTFFLVFYQDKHRAHYLPGQT